MTDDTELTNGDLARIEYKLKKSLARRMGSIQEDRAVGGPSGRNVGNARKYVEEAQTLRRILLMERRQNYVPLYRMGNAAEWLSDEVVEAAGVDTVRDPLHVVSRKVHGVGNPHFEPGTMTDHESVPGRPSV